MLVCVLRSFAFCCFKTEKKIHMMIFFFFFGFKTINITKMSPVAAFLLCFSSFQIYFAE